MRSYMDAMRNDACSDLDTSNMHLYIYWNDQYLIIISKLLIGVQYSVATNLVNNLAYLCILPISITLLRCQPNELISFSNFSHIEYTYKGMCKNQTLDPSNGLYA